MNMTQFEMLDAPAQCGEKDGHYTGSGCFPRAQAKPKAEDRHYENATPDAQQTSQYTGRHSPKAQ
jgi:hypothetical protein